MAHHLKSELDHLRARFPRYEFWHVPVAYGPDAWCWRPLGSDDGSQSKHRGTPQEVAAAITGTEHTTRIPSTRERTAKRD